MLTLLKPASPGLARLAIRGVAMASARTGDAADAHSRAHRLLEAWLDAGCGLHPKERNK